MQQTTPHSPITGKDNTTIKYLRSLAEPKYRKKERAFLIEGIRMVEEALRDNLGATMVVAAPSLVQRHGKGLLKLAENRHIPVLWISGRLMDALSESKTPQPVMAVVTMREHAEEELLTHSSKLIVIAYQLQDPGNLGTIIRTAEAVGASGLALTQNTVDPFNAKAVRASMGSVLRLPVVTIPDHASFIRKCKEAGFQTAAAVLTGGKSHFETDFTGPTALVFGQEGAGLPQELVGDIDLPVRIPMAAPLDSLNVATAAAVILYEIVRQRLEKT
jgi:TrmH family RNA methyltransferase